VPASDQPDRVKGPQGRARLCASTAAGIALVAGVALMALPRDPGHAGSGIKLALQDPIVLIPLLAVTTLVLLASIRAWTYRRLTRLPGPILAHTLVDARATAGSADEIPITLLDTRFRQRLSELQLSAATPSPGGTPTTDFIELLETSTFDPKQPFATLGRILRLVRPTHAYEVRTTLLQRDKAPSRGVALEVVVLPQRRTTLRMYWRTNWAAALDRAATGVAAEVVPRSRHSDTGVWSTWQGLVLDDELFDLYQRSQILRGAAATTKRSTCSTAPSGPIRRTPICGSRSARCRRRSRCTWTPCSATARSVRRWQAAASGSTSAPATSARCCWASASGWPSSGCRRRATPQRRRHGARSSCACCASASGRS